MSSNFKVMCSWKYRNVLKFEDLLNHFVIVSNTMENQVKEEHMQMHCAKMTYSVSDIFHSPFSKHVFRVSRRREKASLGSGWKRRRPASDGWRLGEFLGSIWYLTESLPTIIRPD